MVNKVILLGRLGKDPETQTTKNGKQMTKFPLATSENYKDKNGEWQERTEWHNVVMFGRDVRASKGDLVFVEGRIETSKVEEKYYTSIIANWTRKVQGNESTKKAPAQRERPGSEDVGDDLPF